MKIGECSCALKRYSAQAVKVNGEAPGKKHPCPDCAFCQWCSDDRCRLCLDRGSCRGRKLSLQEQIELYEAVNGRGKGEK